MFRLGNGEKEIRKKNNESGVKFRWIIENREPIDLSFYNYTFSILYFVLPFNFACSIIDASFSSTLLANVMTN